MTATSIEWVRGEDDSEGKSWNPLRGCSLASDECMNCYAQSIARRFSGPGKPFEGLINRHGKWNGVMRQAPEHTLYAPLSWKQPTRVFVNSMTDLFHENAEDWWIDEIFAVMALAPRHTFIVLSKRAERMRAYMTSPDRQHHIARSIDAVTVNMAHDPVERWATIPGYDGYEASSHGRVRSRSGILATDVNAVHGREQVTLWNKGEPRTWYIHALVLMAHRGLPTNDDWARHLNGDKTDNRLANLAWGSASDNRHDTERHGRKACPAKLNFQQVQEIRAARADGSETQQQIADRYGISRSLVSMIEHGVVWKSPLEDWPLRNVIMGVSVGRREFLSRIDHLRETPAAVRLVSFEPLLESVGNVNLHGISWSVIGGESGPGARPFNIEWAREIIAQCRAQDCAPFVKQLGRHPVLTELADLPERQVDDDGTAHWFTLDYIKDKKGAVIDEWPQDLRVREFPRLTP